MRKSSADDEFIPSLEKALAVIGLFSSQRPEWTLSQVSRELDLTPGSTRRILRTLELLGYAVSIEGRYRLTARILNLGFAYLSSQPFSEAAQPLLRELATRPGMLGQIFTKSNIGNQLAMRDLMADLRAADPFRQGGGKPFSKADRSRFPDALEREVRAAQK